MRVPGRTMAVLLLLAACGPGGGAQDVPAPLPNEADSQDVPVAPAAEAESRSLAVDAEGLRLVDPATGSTRPLPFGMPMDELISWLEAIRGPADRGTNEECGAGPLDFTVWADGLTLYFQNGAFAGWALDPRAKGVHGTMSGIGPGSTRAELEAAYDVMVEQTTLGAEFTAGGLSGVLEGDGPEARIGSMWAGLSCVFR